MPGSTPAGVNSSHQDANQQYSTLLVAGTLGTADTGGTALTMPASGNPVTGAAYVEVIGGASSSGTNVNIFSGTQQVAGTVLGGTIENINGGTITLTNPTGTVVTVDHGTVTVSNPVVAVTVGTIPQISVGTLPSVTLANPGTIVNIATGTQQTLGTVGSVNGVAVVSALTNGSVNILTGTLQSAGTITGVGVVSNLTNGSVNVLSGTINVGTVDTELPAAAVIGSNTANPTVPGVQTFPMLWDGASWQRLPGDINGGVIMRQFQSSAADADTISNSAAAPQSSSGNPLYHRTTLHALNAAATWGRVRDANAAANTVGTGLLGVGIMGQDSGGTYHNLAVSTGGSLGTIIMPQLSVGTVGIGTFVNNGGSVQVYQGTVQQNMVPVVVGTSYGTLGTTGVLVWGTLVPASGAGTKQYVSGLSIVVIAGTVDCAITYTGTLAAPQSGIGVLARGQFGPGGGIARDFSITKASGTNGTLAYYMGGAGTAYFVVDYWNGV